MLPVVVLAYLLLAAVLSKASGTAGTPAKESKSNMPAVFFPFPFGISPGSGF